MFSVSTLRGLEFDRIVHVVAGLAVTPTGMDRLAELRPLTEVDGVVSAQKATSEGVRDRKSTRLNSSHT